MASLAPHVSRVSKDYAPHGYSIYNEVVVDIGDTSATATDLFVLGATDSDIYIEAITLLSEGSATTGWTLQADYKNATGGPVAPTPATMFAVPGWVAVTNHVPATSTPDQNQLIPQGRGMSITLTRSGGNTLTALKVMIRYRRKA
mgnify:CR=1 FL=1